MPEMDSAPELPVVYRCTIGPEWVDFNGHLRDGYYMVLFSSAVDALMDLAGLDAAGRKATGHSWFTLEAHVNILDARGAISVAERTSYIHRVRNLARKVAQAYLNQRESMGFPLLRKTSGFRYEGL